VGLGGLLCCRPASGMKNVMYPAIVGRATPEMMPPQMPAGNDERLSRGQFASLCHGLPSRPAPRCSVALRPVLTCARTATTSLAGKGKAWNLFSARRRSPCLLRVWPEDPWMDKKPGVHKAERKPLRLGASCQRHTAKVTITTASKPSRGHSHKRPSQNKDKPPDDRDATATWAPADAPGRRP
jgi:hypothetical protein